MATSSNWSKRPPNGHRQVRVTEEVTYMAAVTAYPQVVGLCRRWLRFCRSFSRISIRAQGNILTRALSQWT